MERSQAFVRYRTQGSALPGMVRENGAFAAFPAYSLDVEDEILIALDLEKAMADLGYDVCGIAANESKARSLAMQGHPDIVLMDVCLSGGHEGIETGRWLREVCGTAVVFVTAQVDAHTVQRIHKQVPGAPVVPKPFYTDSLAQAVATAVSH